VPEFQLILSRDNEEVGKHAFGSKFAAPRANDLHRVKGRARKTLKFDRECQKTIEFNSTFAHPIKSVACLIHKIHLKNNFESNLCSQFNVEQTNKEISFYRKTCPSFE